MVINEIKKLINRKQFTAVEIILFTAVFADFFFNCTAMSGKNLTEIQSAYNILPVTYSSFTIANLLYGSFIFPLVISVAVADFYAEESINGLHDYVYTRVSRSEYMRARVISADIVTVLLVVVPLFAEMILAATAFPAQGLNTELPAYEMFMTAKPDMFFGFLEYSYPYVYAAALILWRALFATACVNLSLAVSLKSRNRYIVLLLPTLIYLAYSLITDFASGLLDGIISEAADTLITTNPMGVFHYGYVWVAALYIAIEFGVSLLIIHKWCNGNEDCL